MTTHQAARPVQTRITRKRKADYAFELRELFARRELIKYLTISTLKSGHRQLALGQLWWLLEPVLSMLIYVFLVEVIFQRGIPNYAVFVFCAILPYRWFTQAVSQTQAVITRIGGLMREVAFPKPVYPISLVLSNFFNFSVGLVFFVGLLAFSGIYPTLRWFWLPALAAQMFVFSLGMSLLIGSLTVLFQDLKNIMAFVFQITFYLSPTLYPVDYVPERFRALYSLNPFVTIFSSWRDVLMYDRTPDLSALGVVSLMSIALLVIGYVVFVRLEKIFPKIL